MLLSEVGSGGITSGQPSKTIMLDIVQLAKRRIAPTKRFGPLDSLCHWDSLPSISHANGNASSLNTFWLWVKKKRPV